MNMAKSDKPISPSDKPAKTSKIASDELTEDDLKKVSGGSAPRHIPSKTNAGER
jgi:bacteriocin-like protein